MGDVRRALGLPITTTWRRVVRLESEGRLRRVVRSGGSGGSSSTVEFEGSLDELVAALGSVVRRTVRFDSLRPGPFRQGPDCPRCGKATEIRSAMTAWCPVCKWGYVLSAETRRKFAA
jgi:ribosomal protein L37AE/L43A